MLAKELVNNIIILYKLQNMDLGYSAYFVVVDIILFTFFEDHALLILSLINCFNSSRYAPFMPLKSRSLNVNTG